MGKKTPNPALITSIIEKSMKDPAFRQRLLTDADAAIESELGPDARGLRVKVIEEDPDVFVLTIPKMPPRLPGDLSDDQLRSVGGASALTTTRTAVVICICKIF